MAFPSASVEPARGAAGRERSLDAIRLGAGVVSLVGAVSAALYFRSDRALFVALIAGGILVFALVMISFGRSVTRRWVAFGQTLGFAPASRRGFFDFGTDRPVLLGRVGTHAARLRLVLARQGRAPMEWLEAETDLFAPGQDARAQHERAWTAARAIAPTARVRLREGRIAVRVPFDPSDALRVLVALREAADAVERA